MPTGRPRIVVVVDVAVFASKRPGGMRGAPCIRPVGLLAVPVPNLALKPDLARNGKRAWKGNLAKCEARESEREER